MLDLIKKSLLTGIGLAVMTKEKAEKLAKDLAAEGELSEKEGREFVDDLVKKSEQARADFEAKVEAMVREAVGKLNIATKDDVAELAQKIESLKQEREGT